MIDAFITADGELTMKNIKNYQATLVMTNTNEFTLFDDTDSVDIPVNSIAFIEKGIKFNVRVKKTNKKEKSKPYDICPVDRGSIGLILDVFSKNINTHGTSLNHSGTRLLSEKVFSFVASDMDKYIFSSLSTSRRNNVLFASKIMHLLSMLQCRDKLFLSIVASSSRTFSDKIIEFVENDIQKKWKISDLADLFFCSEITIRKKLEKENINFSQLMLDIRMKHAARRLLQTECNVSAVANSVGISNKSYFIRLFKDYYGVTPKKYYFALMG
ncbi:helix-turn-helix transcriptional regulator [Escherichia coli]|uniref:helix-turn-helix transcriptional regulator n=1 Tax=Escherichia coli TaxID=562 RepID=UPI000E1CDA04|nr:helix-turn-helix transcriptional regulator [Escherichia coli]EFH6920372.1 helix-turn-helix domain-containing protein [Escherichia coli]RDS02470.1 Virulence regulon transcriptional activator VirF [Escherichia coli]RDS21314.1 Virulence regulon transcriptional activator VirF [Escherichia coli]